MPKKRPPIFVPIGFMICLMCCVSCGKSTPPIPKQAEFTFWVVGSGDVKTRFGTAVYQVLDDLRESTGHLDDFLFVIAEEPLTADRIQRRSGLSSSQVEYLIAELEACRSIKKDNHNRWAATIPVVSDNRMQIMRRDLARMAADVADYLKGEAPRLRTLYNQAKSSLDPSWEDVSHLIIDKFIIDGAFHVHINRLKREAENRESDGGETHVMPAFLLQKGQHFSNFGCNWYKFNEGNDQREVYVLHGGVLDRYDIAMNRHRRDPDFAACLLHISPEGEIHDLTPREKDMLSDLGWISGKRLLVPIVQAETIKSLQPAIESIGREAAEVAFARFTDLTDSFNGSPFSKFLKYKEDYIQVLIHALFGLTIERLVENGTVARVPETVPESFGVFIVSGDLF